MPLSGRPQRSPPLHHAGRPLLRAPRPPDLQHGRPAGGPAGRPLRPPAHVGFHAGPGLRRLRRRRHLALFERRPAGHRPGQGQPGGAPGRRGQRPPRARPRRRLGPRARGGRGGPGRGGRAGPRARRAGRRRLAPGPGQPGRPGGAASGVEGVGRPAPHLAVHLGVHGPHLGAAGHQGRVHGGDCLPQGERLCGGASNFTASRDADRELPAKPQAEALVDVNFSPHWDCRSWSGVSLRSIPHTR
mmetsp:Transcript_57224/g.167465  ORF Transcript_57224/g.167465 Transcript_57224/m.167465 type:complete len:244 (+) Transcript_57224:957-1688(+)